MRKGQYKKIVLFYYILQYFTKIHNFICLIKRTLVLKIQLRNIAQRVFHETVFSQVFTLFKSTLLFIVRKKSTWTSFPSFTDFSICLYARPLENTMYKFDISGNFRKFLAFWKFFCKKSKKLKVPRLGLEPKIPILKIVAMTLSPTRLNRTIYIMPMKDCWICPYFFLVLS